MHLVLSVDTPMLYCAIMFKLLIVFEAYRLCLLEAQHLQVNLPSSVSQCLTSAIVELVL